MSLLFIQLIPGHFRESEARWIPRTVRAHSVKAVVSKLVGKSSEKDEEEHDQSPLALSCLHVDALNHQGKVCIR